MRSLDHEFEALVTAYLASNCPLEDVRDWLIDCAQAIVDVDDPILSRRTGRAWILLSEWDADYISDDDVRTALGELIPAERRITA